MQYHFVLIDYLCRDRRAAGSSTASDAADGRSSPTLGQLAPFDLTQKALDVIARGVRARRRRHAAEGRTDPFSLIIVSETHVTLSREDAWALVTEYTQSESLRKHMLAVDAAVRGYARLWGENEEDWGVVALLHDFDYERWPDQQNHPFRGVEILKEKGYPEWVTRAILSHADYSGVPRESRLEKTLYACDEMSGFVTAAALVRPVEERARPRGASVLKRMKDKAFARAVSREDLKRGAEELGLPLEEHVANVINFLRLEAEPLGLKGNL